MSNSVQSQDLPLSGVARDGWSTETEATATCFCGAVQVVVVCCLPFHIIHNIDNNAETNTVNSPLWLQV